jgi:drug/metabolite transporter (DMT)-like permease
MIVIRPGLGMVQAAALVLLAAALVNATFHLLTRQVGKHDGSLTTLFYTAVLGAVLSSAVVPFFWTAPPDARVWGLMLLMGALGAGSQFALIKAFQAAPPSAIAPFNYTTIIWATGLGFLVFGELPDTPTVIGAGIIIASGLYVFHRERVVGRAEAAAAGAAPRETLPREPLPHPGRDEAAGTAEPEPDPTAHPAEPGRRTP